MLRSQGPKLTPGECGAAQTALGVGVVRELNNRQNPRRPRVDASVAEVELALAASESRYSGRTRVNSEWQQKRLRW